MEPEEAKVKQVSSLSQSVPLPSNSPESENSQGHESESAWEDMMISLVGALYVLCGKFFCYPFARGEKQNKTPFLAGIWVTVWEENVAKGLHCPTVWDLSDNLDWIYVHEASMPRCGALLRGLTYLHHSTTRGHTPAPGETLSGISRHGALDVFSTRHPRAPGPDRWKDNPVRLLSRGCLSQRLGSLMSTMET